MKISLRGNKSIRAVFDSQVVRLYVSAWRVVGLDVFSEFFEVVWSDWMLIYNQKRVKHLLICVVESYYG